MHVFDEGLQLLMVCVFFFSDAVSTWMLNSMPIGSNVFFGVGFDCDTDLDVDVGAN